MNDIENILDLNASEIDELIQTLKEIEDLALSSDGLGQINMVIDLFENNLDGLYKKAMVEQVKVRKQTFIEVIEELRDRRIRLERYREFLQTGARVKVVQNQNYINVNPIEDMKNASDLELAIGILIPKIQDDYDVIREADNEIDELEAIIASKLRQEPPQDVSHERELISILNTNKGLFNALDSSIPKSLTNTSKMPEDFDEVNNLFRTDLDNYHTVWDSTTDYKIEEMGILSGIGEFFSNLFWKDDEKEKMKSCPPPEGVYGPPGPDFCGMNGKDLNTEEILANSISEKGMDLLRSWEYGSENYYSTIPTLDGSEFNIDCQVPYDVGDEHATIGPGIAEDRYLRDGEGNKIGDADWETNLNKDIATGLGVEIDSIPVGTDGVCIPRATLDKAAEGLMNDKYIPHVLGGVDYYNQETDSNLELSQVQLDAIASLYWNTGDSILYYNSYEDSSDYITTTGIDDVGEVQWIQDQTVEFYSNIENANNAIASGDLEKATEDLDDAFSSLYNKGNPDALQKERIDDTINYYMNNDEWETRFEIDDEK